MVISQAHAVRQSEARKGGQLVGVLLPFQIAQKPRALVQGIRSALDGIGHFTVHHYLGAVFRQ